MTLNARQIILLLLTGIFLSAQFALAYHNVVHAVEPQFSIAKIDGDHHKHKDTRDNCDICVTAKSSTGTLTAASVVLHVLPVFVAFDLPQQAAHFSTFIKAYNAQGPPALS